MPFNPILFNEKYRIPSARGGCYHVTIKTQNAIQYFGHITRNPQTRQNEMHFSELGAFVNSEIPKIMDHYWYVNIMNHVVMPNHIHILMMIDVRGSMTAAIRGGNDGLIDNNNPCRDVPRNVSTKCLVGVSSVVGASPNDNTSPVVGASPNDNASPVIGALDHDRRTPELMSSISPKTGSLSLVIRQFKQSITIYAKQHQIPFAWQPRFYESVITKQYEFDRVWRYIDNNVAKWHTDHFYP